MKKENLSNLLLPTKQDGSSLAEIGMNNINMNIKDAELGYWIGKPYWHRGYCTEAARVVAKIGI